MGAGIFITKLGSCKPELQHWTEGDDVCACVSGPNRKTDTMAENPCKTNMDDQAVPPNHSQTISNSPVEEAVHVLQSIWPREAPCKGHALLKTTLCGASPNGNNENNSTTSTPNNGKLSNITPLMLKNSVESSNCSKEIAGSAPNSSTMAGPPLPQLASCDIALPELGDKSSSTSVLTTTKQCKQSTRT